MTVSCKPHLFSLLLLPLISHPSAWADPITFFNTGVAANGSLLPVGSADSHYTLIYSADPSGIATVSNTGVQSGTAGWITPGADGTQSWASGYYVYEAILDLTGYMESTAVLSGFIAADDSVSIFLNRGGSAVFSGANYWGYTPFQINSGFVSGINRIDFVVHNDQGPTGLSVDGTSVSAMAPEPGSFLLLATGLVGVASVVARKMRPAAL